ncbi:MAG: helix-turn-helix domain-containing protein [Lachnospiraceae bacterium]|nr:helix-turn-helix domain-containing protein [Lachnospiraceae bacterium]
MINYESDLISNLSRNVKKIMTDQKISINELAKKTGLSFSVIRNIRDGKIKKLNAQNIYRLVVYLHISPSQLLGTDSIPAELNITEECVEFITSFFEREAGDFTFDNHCQFLEGYDLQYEECIVNALHSYIEAHKMATGYYHETINPAKTKSLTKDSIDKAYREYVLNEIFQKFSDENEGMDENNVKDERVKVIDKIAAAGMAIKQLRELYGLTRKELGIRTRLGEDCIYRIESGINKKINYEHINLIARELLCTTDFLLGESCDPTSNRDGSSLFYRREGLVFRHVQLGHDLAYAWNYMDSESKEVLVNMIHTLNTMYNYKKVSEDSFGKRLSIQEVFFREQDLYMKRYKNRGAHFYTQKYMVDKGE